MAAFKELVIQFTLGIPPKVLWQQGETMKKIVKTTVLWRFSLAPVDMRQDRRVFVPSPDGNRAQDLILGEIIIESLFKPHPAGGRCVYVRVNGIRPGGKEVYTDRFIGAGRMSCGVSEKRYVSEASGFYWSLHRGEEFLDGALRIGQLILEKLGAKCKSDWLTHERVLGNFTITQSTYVLMSGRVWRPIEYYLCVKNGWEWTGP